jgi:hypothetical protein
MQKRRMLALCFSQEEYTFGGGLRAICGEQRAVSLNRLSCDLPTVSRMPGSCELRTVNWEL